MLDSVYISLTIVAFTFLLASLLDKKMIAKIILSGISSVVFFVLAISSVQVEVLECISASCTMTPYFYGDVAWMFWASGTIAVVLTLMFTFVLIFNFRTLTTGDI